MNPLRVLHCPTMTGGNPQGVARAERQLGLNSIAIAFSQKYFAYTSDEILWDNKENYLRNEILRWQLLWRAIRHFDVIHFNSGSTILPSRIPTGVLEVNKNKRFLRRFFNWYAWLFELQDLLLLKKMGKAIVVTYQGDDARQGSYCKKNFDITIADEVGAEYYSLEEDLRKQKRIKTFDRYADRIYALNPDLLHVLPQRAEFLPYAHVDLQDWRPNITSGFNSACPLVIHAPSDQSAKGTRYILEAVSRLRAEKVPFDFEMIEARSNFEARQIYGKADLLIDQLLAGWYGGLSVELMALGKPVICYIRESDLKFIPEKMQQEMPLINANPTTIYQVLKDYLTHRRKELLSLGEMGRRYVEKWHNPIEIGSRLKKDYYDILSTKKRRREG